jgi:apolipoprotein N-acyltransferase
MLDESREFVPDIQVRTVPARTARTLSDRLGEAPEGALAALALGAVLAGVWTARKNEGN